MKELLLIIFAIGFSIQALEGRTKYVRSNDDYDGTIDMKNCEFHINHRYYDLHFLNTDYGSVFDIKTEKTDSTQIGQSESYKVVLNYCNAIAYAPTICGRYKKSVGFLINFKNKNKCEKLSQRPQDYNHESNNTKLQDSEPSSTIWKHKIDPYDGHVILWGDNSKNILDHTLEYHYICSKDHDVRKNVTYDKISKTVTTYVYSYAGCGSYLSGYRYFAYDYRYSFGIIGVLLATLVMFTPFKYFSAKTTIMFIAWVGVDKAILFVMMIVWNFHYFDIKILQLMSLGFLFVQFGLYQLEKKFLGFSLYVCGVYICPFICILIERITQFVLRIFTPDYYTICQNVVMMIGMLIIVHKYKQNNMLGFVLIALAGSETFCFYLWRIVGNVMRIDSIMYELFYGQTSKAYITFFSSILINLLITSLAIGYRLMANKDYWYEEKVGGISPDSKTKLNLEKSVVTEKTQNVSRDLKTNTNSTQVNSVKEICDNDKIKDDSSFVIVVDKVGGGSGLNNSMKPQSSMSVQSVYTVNTPRNVVNGGNQRGLQKKTSIFMEQPPKINKNYYN